MTRRRKNGAKDSPLDIPIPRLDEWEWADALKLRDSWHFTPPAKLTPEAIGAWIEDKRMLLRGMQLFAKHGVRTSGELSVRRVCDEGLPNAHAETTEDAQHLLEALRRGPEESRQLMQSFVAELGKARMLEDRKSVV